MHWMLILVTSVCIIIRC
ncbi:hypothetical protein MTR67_032349 [Solanum verrucosum]|uniref:Uncharacterized protein n=1 Tax=Solanum verrucosum TaxID=315347 RepID=A0AAF0U4A0_SOLVR|nr:hypothetical protein MTR67_032349 [Solanum verrucosum]